MTFKGSGKKIGFGKLQADGRVEYGNFLLAFCMEGPISKKRFGMNQEVRTLSLAVSSLDHDRTRLIQALFIFIQPIF